MPKAFRLASWNVEHFKGDPARVTRIIDFVKDRKPDVFALYEVEAKKAFDALVKKLPKYTFHITEGRETQEILVGVKNTFTAFFTQRLEFQTGNTYLRPGALLTLTIDKKHYNVLFLHTKSSSKPVGLGLRDEMFQKAFHLKKALDKVAGGAGKANFLFLGDLNIMGMKYPYQGDIAPEKELKALRKAAGKAKMTLLEKDAPATWWNGPDSRYAPANLDHVIASNHLRFKTYAGGAQVNVLGWPKEPTDAAKGRWIARYSDHGLLQLEVQKV